MAEDRIGRDRIKGAYAWRTLLDSGALYRTLGLAARRARVDLDDGQKIKIL